MKLLVVILFTLQISVVAQKRITVQDTDIEFSYELPKKWEKFDDGYFLFLIPPTQNGDEMLSITYVESEDADLDLHFKFTIENLFPLNEPSYQLIKKGDEQVGELSAKWAIFDTRRNNINYRNFLFFFNQNGQTFKLRGIARTENFEKYKDSFLTISKSIRSKAR